MYKHMGKVVIKIFTR